MIRSPSTRRGRAGFTLIELAVAATIFSLIGYALLMAVQSSQDSHRAVARQADRNRELCASTRILTEELGCASTGTITIAHDANGNATLSFMMPLDAAGTLGASLLGVPHPGWRVAYETDVVGGEAGLVRRVLDDTGAQRGSQVLFVGIRDAAGGEPGFDIVQEGEMWSVTLSSERSDRGGSIDEVFHVHTRD